MVNLTDSDRAVLRTAIFLRRQGLIPFSCDGRPLDISQIVHRVEVRKPRPLWKFWFLTIRRKSERIAIIRFPEQREKNGFLLIHLDVIQEKDLRYLANLVDEATCEFGFFARVIVDVQIYKPARKNLFSFSFDFDIPELDGSERDYL